MADIYSKGKQSVDGIDGGLRFEKDNNRIIGRDENNIPNLIISSVPGQNALIEVAQAGYDVTTATDDQKVMSSNFNMYKIITSGDLTVAPRNANITLTTTNIGYQLSIIIKNVVPNNDSLAGDLFIRVSGKTYFSIIGEQMDIKGSGNFYDNGTNKAIYSYDYRIFHSDLIIEFKVRLLAGSLTFNPTSVFAGDLHWEICNHTIQSIPGGGVVLPGDGKYYFSDYIVYNPDGTIATPISSQLIEFTGGESNHFPKPNSMIIGYKRW
jgi:hypothetical protein